MALIKCPECGKEISDQTKLCPHCGAPAKKLIKKEKEIDFADKICKFLVIGALFFVAYMFLGTMLNSDKEIKQVSDSSKNWVGMNITVEKFVNRYNTIAPKKISLEAAEISTNENETMKIVTWSLSAWSFIKITSFSDTQKIIKIEGKLDKNEFNPGATVECLIALIKTLSPNLKEYKADALVEKLFLYDQNNKGKNNAELGNIRYDVHNDNPRGIVIFSVVNVADF